METNKNEQQNAVDYKQLYEELKSREESKKEVFDSIVNIEDNEVTRENANINADTPAGMMMKFGSETTKDYTNECLLSEETLKYLKGNYLYIHDRDFYPTKSLTCLQTNASWILENGFMCGNTFIRPAKHIESAVMLSVLSMAVTTTLQHGGQALFSVDYDWAPYVRKTYIEELKKLETATGVDFSQYYDEQFKDYLIKDLTNLKDVERLKQAAMNNTVKRVYQAVESGIYTLNTYPSRSGAQVLFSSINLGTDTSAEGRCVIRAILEQTYKGVGNGETAIFPIIIWKSKAGINYNPEDPNYDLYEYSCKVSARRFFPNYVNLDASYNQVSEEDKENFKKYCEENNIEYKEHYQEVATMGCRTRVFENRFGPKTSVGRGNISFSTINIVRLAIECMSIKDQDERIKEFFKKLDVMLEVIAKQLDERFQFQKTAKKCQMFNVMNGLWLGSEKLKADDTIESVINQGTLAIGFIGLAECLVALTGKHHGESEDSQKLGLKIVTYMRDRANELSERYHHNYSVFGTPAEGLSGKFTKIDQKDFGKIPGVTDRDYYTNSNHVPVYYKISARKKAEIEAPYHNLTRGGHIFYVEIDGDATHNPEVIMKIVDMAKKLDMGYVSVNHIRNRCLDCGYENADHELKVCPKCGSTRIDQLQRITGYLSSTVSRWNHGKREEFKDRVQHVHGTLNDDCEQN